MVNENYPYSSSEMLYGTSFRLSGEYFYLSTKSHSPSAYIFALRCFMKRMQPVRAHLITSQLTNLHPDLSSSSHVFVGQDGVQFPLQRPCRGPYRILPRSDEVFTLELDRNMDKVCVDCLKPTNMLNCFDNAALEPNMLRDRPPNKGVATASSSSFSGPDSPEVSIGASLSAVTEVPLLATRRGRIVRKPDRCL